MRRLAVLGVYLFAILSPAAGAAPANAPLPGTAAWAAAPHLRTNVSYSIWVVTGRQVVLRYMVPASEAEAAVGRAPFLIVQQRLGNYLLEHTAVTAGGHTCPPQDQGYDLGTVDPVSVGAGLYGFEIFFHCPLATGRVLIDSALFDRLPGQVNFAQVTVNGRTRQEVFVAGKAHLRLPDSGALRSAGMARYVPLGLRYAFRHLEFACFLLGSLTLLVASRELLWLGAGLAGGVLLSLGLALSDGIAPRSPVLLGAFAGFLVTLPALRHMTRSMHRPGLLACAAMAVLFALAAAALFLHRDDAAILLAGAALFAGGMLAASRETRARLAWLLIPATMLGLIEGLTLPQQIQPLHLPAAARLPMVGGFDLGLLASDALLLLCAAGVRLGLRQSGSPRKAAAAADWAAAVVGGLGIYWLVSRLYL